MFSVGAQPFNSKPRQLYGGWLLGDTANNVWARKTYYEMARKYSTDEDEREEAAKWLRWWKAYAREHPAETRARLRLAGKPYWEKAIRPALTPDQKAAIWAAFKDVPLDTDITHQRMSAFLRHAPYPNRAMMNWGYETGVPYMPFNGMAEGSSYTPEVALGPNSGWRSMDDLREAFKANKRKARPPSKAFLDYVEQNLPKLEIVKPEGME